MPKTKETRDLYNSQKSYQIKCPYCDGLNKFDNEGEAIYDNETYECLCEHCNKEFIVRPDVSVTYSSEYVEETEDGEEEPYEVCIW